MVRRGSKGATQASVNDIEEKLDHASHGLAALKLLIDAVEGKLDVPTNFMADVSALALEASLVTHDINIQLILAALNDISAADVWTYVSRTLTPHAFPFTNPGAALDVSNIRTAAYGQYNTEMARITANVATEAKQDIIDGLIDDIIADIGVFPTTNYATLAAYVEDMRTRLIAIVGDTNELQTDWANGGRLDLLLDAVALEATLGTHDTDIKTLLATIAGYLDTEIAAIETKLDTPANFMADVSGLAPAGEYDTEMGRITADVATESKQDIIDTNVDDIETDTADMQPRVPRIVCNMDFPSLPLQVTLTSVAGDRGLVDVVVSGLPAGVTIIAVQAIFHCDSVENSFDGVNYLESTKIQVKEKIAGTDRDAITLEANKIFRFTAQMIRGGTVLRADWATATDAGILAEVTGNATYQMWFDVGETAQNNIVLDGAVFMLRIWYSI